MIKSIADVLSSRIVEGRASAATRKLPPYRETKDPGRRIVYNGRPYLVHGGTARLVKENRLLYFVLKAWET